MPPPTLSLPPDQSNYAVTDGHTTVSTKLDGGASRFRADQQGATFLVDVQWRCDATNFNYLKAFYRTAVAFGSLPFIVGLYLDNATINNYTAFFVPDTFKLASQQGQTFTVTAQLEVIPDPTQYVNDATIIAAGPDAH